MAAKKTTYKKAPAKRASKPSVKRLYCVLVKRGRADMYVTGVGIDGVTIADDETPKYYDKNTADIIAVLLRVYAKQATSVIGKATYEKTKK